jgi:hypothetical protein
MLWRWFPWRQVVRRWARSRGLVDPIGLLSRLERFGQPLEVKEPLELLRAGVVFHARGLLNTGAIQHNLDWIWPFWVERQYIGLPDEVQIPIVDPRGLLTPLFDGWSLDCWLVREGGPWLVPSQLESLEQELETEGGLAVATRSALDGDALGTRAFVEEENGRPVCRLEIAARSAKGVWLAVALRPYNPEGVSFVHRIEAEGGLSGWRLDRKRTVRFEPGAERFRFSDYRRGDVHARLFDFTAAEGASCRVGMATAAALFSVVGERRVRVSVPLEPPGREGGTCLSWSRALEGAVVARLPEARFQKLFDAAVRSLVLHAPGGDVYPGPYTYKRFWFRDAAFILHALLCLGLERRVEGVLDTFPGRQKPGGFFHSQEGEWDSNGEALWILERFCRLTGRPPKPAWRRAIDKGGRWIGRKRLSSGGAPETAGLLPPGFSAEHLGPNDYYYWDDFWGVAGLQSAANLLEGFGALDRAAGFRREAEAFLAAIETSLAGVAARLGSSGMPASPGRRLDCGAVGSLAAGYPLQLFAPNDSRLVETVAFLLKHAMVDGGFFQDVIHSGINPYLTLHLAQVLLRAGDRRALDLFRSVAALASPTGQWPEAVHPRTGGGCMGDGHHVWASAEWVLMQRNCFLREEGDRLILAAGIFPAWLEQDSPIAFGPAPNAFGALTVSLHPQGDSVRIDWEAAWRQPPEAVEVRPPGFVPVTVKPEVGSVALKRERP